MKIIVMIEVNLESNTLLTKKFIIDTCNDLSEQFEDFINALSNTCTQNRYNNIHSSFPLSRIVFYQCNKLLTFDTNLHV